MQEVCISSILNSSHPLLERIEQTYNESFPLQERRDFALVRELIDSHPLFTMKALLKEGEYVGFLSSWELADFRYVEHFAVDPSIRNVGLGGNALEQYVFLNLKPVVLEVEPPVDDLSYRRIRFYESHGFTLFSKPYFQPPYHKGYDDWLELRLMSWGEANLKQTFDHWRQLIYRTVYGVKD